MNDNRPMTGPPGRGRARDVNSLGHRRPPIPIGLVVLKRYAVDVADGTSPFRYFYTQRGAMKHRDRIGEYVRIYKWTNIGWLQIG